MDMASSQFLFAQGNDNTRRVYKENVAKAIGLPSRNKRVLGNRNSPPVADLSASRSRTFMDNWLTSAQNMTARRRILTAPEKILDAPYMVDDYYLNLLDWSSQNVVAIALNRAVYLWNADMGSVSTLGSTDAVASLSWSADGAYLAIGTMDGDTQVWDVEANQKLRSMTGHHCRVGVLSWNKHLVSSGAQDGSIWHHDVRVAQHKTMELLSHEQEVCGLEWRGDGGMLASGGNDNSVCVWDARCSKPRSRMSNHVGAVKVRKKIFSYYASNSIDIIQILGGGVVSMEPEPARDGRWSPRQAHPLLEHVAGRAHQQHLYRVSSHLVGVVKALSRDRVHPRLPQAPTHGLELPQDG